MNVLSVASTCLRKFFIIRNAQLPRFLYSEYVLIFLPNYSLMCMGHACGSAPWRQNTTVGASQLQDQKLKLERH